MTEAEVTSGVTSILSRTAKQSVAPDRIDADARLAEDCGVDSIELVNLMLTLEKAFGIRISEEELGGATFDTVGSLVRFVTERVQAVAR
jgi:acyl carrier protein